MKLAHLSDIHVDSRAVDGHGAVARLEAALARLLVQHADVGRIVITGNLTHRGDAASYRLLRGVLADVGLVDGDGLDPRLRLLIGSHDDRGAFLQAFPEVWTDPCGHVQSIDAVSVGRFVYLDTVAAGTRSGHLCPRRMGWLADVLHRAREDAVPAWLFMHHNPVPVSVADADSTGLVQWHELAELLACFPGLVRHVFFGRCHRSLGGSMGGVPISAPRSIGHPYRFDGGGPPDRRRAGPLEPDYTIVLIEPSHTLVHHADVERAGQVDRIATGPVPVRDARRRPGDRQDTRMGDAPAVVPDALAGEAAQGGSSRPTSVPA